MVRYILDKILTAVPLLLLVALGTFALVYFMPGDAAATVAGEGASVAQIEAVRSELGLNDPIIVQFGEWVASMVTGDLGYSYAYGASVGYLIGQRLEVSISLVVVAWLISTIVGVVIGMFAGLRQGGRFDRISTVISSIGLAAPTYWIAILFIIVFSLQLGWFPATGYTSISSSFQGWLASIVLPAAAVSVNSIADVSRQVRSTTGVVRQSDFVRTYTSLGLPKWRIVLLHIGRNIGVPTMTIAGLQIERLIGAVVVVEMLFAMPGFGTLMLGAVLNQDIPVIQASIVLIAAVIIVVNLLVDISYAFINPKIRFS